MLRKPFGLLRRQVGGAPRGVTLVELLVVITIMMLLAAFVLPKFQLNSKTRKIREAARMINVYFGVARNRAVETGRPCGVMFQRLANQPSGAATLFQVEVPPPYAGDVSRRGDEIAGLDR